MKDITAITKVATATSGVYDLLGFESFMIIGTASASRASIVYKAGDDSASLETLPDDSPAIVTRYDGSTMKIGYIGGRRYFSVTGVTVAAAILQNPETAPQGDTEAPASTGSLQEEE